MPHWWSKLLLLSVLSLPSATLAEQVALLFPSVKEPFRSVFTQIAAGAQAELGDGLIVHELDDDFANTAAVSQWISNKKPSGLILLGGRGYKLAHELTFELPMVVGAVPFSPNGVAGVSLASDPRVVFDYLNKMAPRARTVYVVHTNKQKWIITLATAAAEKLQIRLQTAEVSDVIQAAQEYKRVVNVLSQDSALWLLADDAAVGDDSLMSFILESAWDKRFVLFSSTPAHVKRGALFSFLPDNEAMGRELAQLLIALQQRKVDEKVVPVSHLRLAINTRTISHLGLTLSPELKRDVALTFPAQ